MKTFEGKAGIKATVICDSVSEAGVRPTTMEVEYPRIVHAEFLTHRMFSRNAASSRAIPFEKMKQQLTGRPVRFGEANPGMQDKGKDYDAVVQDEGHNGGAFVLSTEEAWDSAKYFATYYAEAFYKAGYHKQVYNRLTEPYQTIKVVVSATEWDNFFHLRNHGAADPTIAELAHCMFEAREASTPQLLKVGEWHLPYITVEREDDGEISYKIGDGLEVGVQYLNLEDAIKISCARCAAVSFRNVDYGVEKSRDVYDKLVLDDRIHGSAMEHCATPMQPAKWGVIRQDDGARIRKFKDPNTSTNIATLPNTWEPGISHADREGSLWSGNFRGFVQYRKLIPNENYTGA